MASTVHLWTQKDKSHCFFSGLSLFIGLSWMSLNLNMVGTTGFEPATSSVSRKRSNQLSYAPANLLKTVYQEPGRGEKKPR